MAQRVYVAVDLGASSGRLVAGLFDGTQLSLEDIHRFENGGVHVGPRTYWDVLGLWREIQKGLVLAKTRYGSQIVSLGVDTWGVDFGLLDENDELLGHPSHYRDRRTDGILDKAFDVVPREEIFAATGLQFMPFNSLFQLWAMRQQSPLVDQAASLLMMPDLFHWMLTGEKSNEYTNATTTQFYDPTRRDWATDLLDRFSLPAQILQPLSQPGTVLGPLAADVASLTGLPVDVQVVLPGTHDTASAVMAVPAETGADDQRPTWCYVSSGTWSLMGLEVAQPVINADCLRWNFTNEGGVGGTTRLLKNIAGLWIVQQCRQVWLQQGNEFSWDELVQRAQASPPLQSVLNPDDPRFVAPINMVDEVTGYCQQTGQTVPATEGGVIRTVLESLALRYRMVLGWLEQLNGGRIETMHIVGGGTQNRLLCQMTADACQRLVIAGPVEATAIGNVMMQAVSDGSVSGIAEARDVIRESFAVQRYEPRDSDPWNDAYERFRALPHQ